MIGIKFNQVIKKYQEEIPKDKRIIIDKHIKESISNKIKLSIENYLDNELSVEKTFTDNSKMIKWDEDDSHTDTSTLNEVEVDNNPIHSSYN